MSNSPKRHRVQLNYSGAAFAEVKELQEKMGASRQDLFRYAVRWLQWTVDEILDGGKFYVKEKNGEMRKVAVPFFTPLEKKAAEQGVPAKEAAQGIIAQA